MENVNGVKWDSKLLSFAIMWDVSSIVSEKDLTKNVTLKWDSNPQCFLHWRKYFTTTETERRENETCMRFKLIIKIG